MLLLLLTPVNNIADKEAYEKVSQNQKEDSEESNE